MTHTKSTGATTATIQWTQDIVLEQTRHAVVGETLAQLDNGHQPGGDGQVLGDMAQGALLILGRLLAIGGHGEVLLVEIHVGLFVQDDLMLNGDGVIVGGRAMEKQSDTRFKTETIPSL